MPNSIIRCIRLQVYKLVMEYKDVIKHLTTPAFDKIKPGLERIEKLLSKAGNPHKELQCIHVAGTNGKGSVCAMLSSVLKEAGYKVGMYTSPHLIDFRERIKINGEDIDKKDVVGLFESVKQYIADQTFFEITTAMAFVFFKEKKVDIAIIEAGMGGLYDATNVVLPLASVITNVSIDHTGYLGNTIDDIAKEKAGIIKKGVPVVTAADGIALGIIKDSAEKNNSMMVLALPTNVKTGLKGGFQKINAGVVIEVLKLMNEKGFDIGIDAVKKGLLKSKWPGRFEFIKPNIIFDCAHNVAGIKCLADELKRITSTPDNKFRPDNRFRSNNRFNKIHVIFGACCDKDIAGMAKIIDSFADKVTITKANFFRAEKPKNIAGYFTNKEICSKEKVSVIDKVGVINNACDAYNMVTQDLKKDELLVVCGSIFLVGEIMKSIMKRKIKGK